MNITVYCGASSGKNSVYKEATIRVGKWIAKNNNTLIYGGGNVGLMGVVADTVLQYQAKAIGVIPTFLKEREMAHKHLTKLYVVNSMDERKKKMLDLGDACLALPGGPGTLEEITEVFSWSRVGENNKPCIFYNVNHYYDLIEQFYNKMVAEEYLSADDRSKLLFSDSLEEIDEFIKNYVPPSIKTYV